MKYILTLNPEYPFNLRRSAPAYGGHKYVGWDEADIIADVIRRGKETGGIPCESKQERDACLALYAARHPSLALIELPAVGAHWIVDEVDMPGGSVSPENDYFFDAWEWVNGRCGVSMSKARTIHLGKIRIARNAKLAALDVPFMRAIESGDTDAQDTIAAEKQALRDIPQTFTLNTENDTPDELEALWPPNLTVEGLP